MNELSENADMHRGYSLVEVMIALTILGIMMNAAVSGYGGYIVKADRQDAISLLSGTALRLERCFTLEGTYNGSCTLKATSDEGYYSLVAIRQLQSYVLTAVPVSGGRQVNDSDCGSFQLTSAGDKSATGRLGRSCW